MNKYNYGGSIPVESVPKDELDQAIKEWSHFNPHMERLIRTCMAKGVKTEGCHPLEWTYLEFILGCNIEEESKLLSTIFKFKDSQIYIRPDGNNPFSGGNWDKEKVSISAGFDTQEEADAYMDELTDSLDKDIPVNSFCKKLIELALYLRNKETRFNIRIIHFGEDNKFYFHIETGALTDELYDYYTNFLDNSGLEKGEEYPHHRLDYVYSSLDSKDIAKKIDEFLNYFKNNFVEQNVSLEDEPDFILYARKKRREFGDTEEGKKQFDLWLKEERRKMIEEWEKADKKRNTK